jgi:quinol-cytochrome oxidoreductase complex cytochrome b subunit
VRAPGRAQRAAEWFDSRTGLIGAWHALMRHPIPGGAAWFHALGAVATFLLAVEFVTGLFLAFYYAPANILCKQNGRSFCFCPHTPISST